MSSLKLKPVIAVTMGDPAGIGPEVVLRALADESADSMCYPVVFGSAAVLKREIDSHQLDLRIVSVDSAHIHPTERGVIQLVETSGDEALVPYGEVSVAGGEAAVAAVIAAADLAVRGVVDGICTAPLNKESMRSAGYHFDGHTELLAEVTGSGPVSMLLLGDRLRVAHMTTHRSLSSVSQAITAERIATVVKIAHEAMQSLGFNEPRIAVAGINPHSGENGLFGDEEMTVMAPAIAALVAEGYRVSGPASPDSVFIDMLSGRYDIVVAAYHDQGHIPVKLLERNRAVNVTGGLPIIRASVDHGTGFDIAGQGVADIENMLAALAVAAAMATRKRSDH